MRYAIRRLVQAPASPSWQWRRSPWAGANAALFSGMTVMLLRALTVKYPEELVEFVRATPDSIMTNLPYPVFQYFQRDRQVLAQVFAMIASNPAFRARAGAERINAHEFQDRFSRGWARGR